VLLLLVGPTLTSQMSTSLSHSQESDFLYLRLSPSSYNNDEVGVWVNVNYEQNSLLCELKGLLIPSGNAENYDLSTILTYKVTSRVGVTYVLVETSLCSRIRISVNCPDCSEVNAVVRVNDIGKLFVFSTRFIAANDEIIMHADISLPPSFNSSCYFSYNGCPIPGPDSDPSVIHTDELALFASPSLVPGAGFGVFAKHDIPKGTIVNLAAGRVILLPLKSNNDRLSHIMSLRENEFFVVSMDNMAGLVNDIVDVRGLKESTFYDVQEEAWHVPHWPGYHLNTVQMDIFGHCAIVTVEDIPAGAELFHDYGPTYWIKHILFPESDIVSTNNCFVNIDGKQICKYH